MTLGMEMRPSVDSNSIQFWTTEAGEVEIQNLWGYIMISRQLNETLYTNNKQKRGLGYSSAVSMFV